MLSAAFLSVFRGVVEFDFAASALIGGIDVQADRPLIEFARIENAVHGLERIHGTGLSWIHLKRVGGLQLAGSFL